MIPLSLLEFKNQENSSGINRFVTSDNIRVCIYVAIIVLFYTYS